MMGKNKWVFWSFMGLDYKAMESYLEDMAQRGWMLKKLHTLFAVFERIPPKRVHFTVDVFEKAGALVKEDTQEAKEYRSLCEETGWRFIDSQRHLQFFCSEEEHRPVEIQTDLETEKRIISSSLWKSQLGHVIYQLALFTMFAFFHYPVGLENIQSNASLIFTGIIPLLWVLSLVHLGYLFVWKHRMKKSVERGEVFSTSDYQRARRKARIFMGFPALLVLVVILALAADLTGDSPLLLWVLMPMGIALIMGILINKVIQKKSDKKRQGLGYMIIGIIITLFVLGNFLPAMLFSEIDRDRSHLPEEYPRLSEDTWENRKDLGDKSADYLRRESFLLPLSYDAYYFFEDTAFNYAYHQGLNQSVAEFIFEDILQDLSNPRHRREEFEGGMEELSFDHELYRLWEGDRIAYDENQRELLILKGERVLRLRGLPDYYDEDLVRGVIKSFF